MISEKPVAKHGEGVDVHPLVLSEALAHAQHGEEIPRNRPVQLGDGRWLTDNVCAHSQPQRGARCDSGNKQTRLTWRDPLKNPPEEAPPP